MHQDSTNSNMLNLTMVAEIYLKFSIAFKPDAFKLLAT